MMRNRSHRSRRDLTGRSKHEALKIAKTLLPRAKAGSREDAELLVDMAIYAGQQHAAEGLHFALRGRDMFGHSQSPEEAAANLKGWFEHVERALFPPRARPCVPNRRELTRLLADSLDASDPADRKRARDLWKTIHKACSSRDWRNVERALLAANDALRGHGVESTTVRLRSGPINPTFDYVNMGDSYSATLLYDYPADRFRVTTYGDMIETWERRWGRAGNDW